jgi:hypothetical protein
MPGPSPRWSGFGRAGAPCDLYAFLIIRSLIPHRFFIGPTLSERSLRPLLKGAIMLDLAMLAIGLGFFALSIAYAVACDWL